MNAAKTIIALALLWAFLAYVACVSLKRKACNQPPVESEDDL